MSGYAEGENYPQYYYYYFLKPSVYIIPREFKNKATSVRGVIGQTIVEQHRVITLYQDRDVLIQEADLSSLARVDCHPDRSRSS